MSAGLSILPHVNPNSFFSQQPPFWTVAELTRYIRQTLESDYRLKDVWVTGEVSNVARPSSGHLYFTIKDARASLRCVMWRSQVEHLPVLPHDGERIEVHGHISVYEAGGAYQLYADSMRTAGEGEAFREFLRVKGLLEAEGLFNPERKRELPHFPYRIGVVASPTSAGLQDVIQVLERRFPLAALILAPSQVQGEDAPQQIVAALQLLQEAADIDVILLVRGGGSAEDLRAFNAEEVVRAVAASQIPTISGVGHETDLILTDFAADVRAPTPSAAAEMAVPDRSALLIAVKEARLTAAGLFSEQLRRLRTALDTRLGRLQLASPRAQIADSRQRVDERLRQLELHLQHRIQLLEKETRTLARTLEAIGPAGVMARGYALILQKEDGRIIRSVRQVKPGTEVQVRVSDGAFDAEVRSVQADSESSGSQ